MDAVAAMAARACSTMSCNSVMEIKRGSREPPFLLYVVSATEARPGLLDDPAKGRLVEHGQVGEDLAIDLDRRLLQARHELAVREAGFPCACIDARDPEAAE